MIRIYIEDALMYFFKSSHCFYILLCRHHFSFPVSFRRSCFFVSKLQFIFTRNSLLIWRSFSFKSNLTTSSSNSEGLPMYKSRHLQTTFVLRLLHARLLLLRQQSCFSFSIFFFFPNEKIKTKKRI